MKKIATATLIALTLSGCGVLANSGIPGLSSSNAANTQSSAQASLYQVMGLGGSSTATDSAQPSSGFSKAQLLFDLLDTNGDGSITLQEFTAAIQSHASTLSSTQVTTLFNQLDLNHDGVITLSELQGPGGDLAGSDDQRQGGRMGPHRRDGHFDRRGGWGDGWGRPMGPWQGGQQASGSIPPMPPSPPAAASPSPAPTASPASGSV